jgi:protein O-GlcNAc transferase
VSDNLEAAKALFVQAAQLLLKEEYAGAEPLLRQALELVPGRPSIVGNLAAALIGQEKFSEARGLAEQATAADPNNAEAWLNLGRCLQAGKDFAAALQACDRALALRPDFAEAWCNRGNIDMAQTHYEAALDSYERAVALKSDFPEALTNLAIVLNRLSRPAEAIPHIDRAIALKPRLPHPYGVRLQAKMSLCDWSSYETDSTAVIRSVADGEPGVFPFTFLGLPSDPALQQRCAASYAARKYPPVVTSAFPPPDPDRKKLRIGYFSADMHRHAIGYLTAGLFEQHDRGRFESHCFSFGPPSTDVIRQRIQAGVDRFHDVHDKSDTEICDLSRRLGIDIAVDLTGYTGTERTGIFVPRAAPLQVNWLGFPGTMGTPIMDYIIADPVIAPPEHVPYFTESVVHLPQTYQSTDNKRQVSDRVFSRAEFGLPENGFVFCSFNNTYKLTPDVFAVWMGLLQQVPDSVLWLLESSSGIADHLRRSAEKHGIAPERIVFAKRMASPEHLARQRLADLFLDTFHYNAHTTTSDALWVGLPVLTKIGNTFASRVAASLLRAANLPELVTETVESYAALALALARDPARLQALRHKLASQRDTCALFDTPRFTRAIEAAYDAMWDRHLRGLPPAAISVDAP